ncbi:MAG: thioredoxin family protein [Gemmatimonadaceae bacterium]
MIVLAHALLAATLCVASPDRAPSPGDARIGVSASDTSYQRLFSEGVTMEAFLDAAKARRAQWLRNYERAAVPDAVVARARSAPGPWHLLVVAVDGCSDSVNTVPYIARLTQKLVGVDVRIVNSDVGRAVMNAHRTPDGRGATPTVILLDANFAERGCWIERPSELQGWIMDNKGKLKDSELFDHKMAWYDEEQGGKTIGEIATMIEAAGRGETYCPAGK